MGMRGIYHPTCPCADPWRLSYVWPYSRNELEHLMYTSWSI